MCDSIESKTIAETNATDVTIDDLPYVVFEYILSHLSPYKELIDCKLVSSSWRSAVIGIFGGIRGQNLMLLRP